MPKAAHLPYRGLTLIELMIGLAIVAVLVALGLPSYRDYLLRAGIGEGISSLQNMRIVGERHYQDNRTYVGMACTATPPTDKFTFDCGTPTATAYTITARGAGSMTGFSYSIDQANQRRTVSLPSGWSGTGATCWVQRKSGSC